MRDVRTGFGYDAHRFGGNGPIILGGIAIESEVGVLATSDGDVAVHAVCDALLGAAVLGDLGHHFPSSDPSNEGASSVSILSQCAGLVEAAGFTIVHIDVTIVAEKVRVSPHRDSMRVNLAGAVGISPDRVSVKATTTDGLGSIGAEEGIAAHAVATLIVP
jgi:2-C-methyl-D-erythritol 2,4-cyclodiphosphate synthase